MCEEIPLLMPENRVTGWVSYEVLAWMLLGLDESFIVNILWDSISFFGFVHKSFMN